MEQRVMGDPNFYIRQAMYNGKSQAELITMHLFCFGAEDGVHIPNLAEYLEVRLPDISSLMKRCRIDYTGHEKYGYTVDIFCPDEKTKALLWDDDNADRIIIESERYFKEPVVLNYDIDRALADKDFYRSKAWISLRYQALRQHGFKCLACGKKQADDIRLHVDHIKPRSKYPHLALKLDNLQVLCSDCNIGKSNIFEDDLRIS